MSFSNNCGKAVFLVVGCAFIATGCLVFCVPLYRTIDAADWRETPCIVISSEVVSGDDDASFSYELDVVYAYKFRGKDYTARRYDFDPVLDGERMRLEVIKDQYPAGKQTTCYVNPHDPRQAVLARHVAFGRLSLYGLVFLISGLFWVFMFRVITRSRPRSRYPHRSMLPLTPSNVAE